MTQLILPAAARWASLAVIGFLFACGGGGADLPSSENSGEATTLALSAPSATVAVGASVQLSAVARDAGGKPVSGLPSPSFATSDPARATVDAGGMVTGAAPGSVTITATLSVNGEILTASAQLTITTAPPAGSNLVTTAGVSFSPASITIAQGDSVSWEFAGATHNVTFLGPAPVAGDIPDQQPGTSVTRVFSAAGTFDYECTRHAGMTGTVIVQSGAARVFTSVTLTPASPSLTVGGTVQLTATPRDQVGNTMSGYSQASFTTGDASKATVSPSGLVTAVAAGSASITATISGGGITHSASVTISVAASQPGGVTVSTPNNSFSPSSVSIPVSGTVTWQISGSTHNVTFSGNAPTGGNIGDTPSGSSVTRTFSAPGTYSYQCTRHSGMSGSVTVAGGSGPPAFNALQVTPQSGVVAVGGTLQLTAEPLDQFGAPMPGLGPASFSSGSTASATVNSSGLVTGISAGNVSITATLTHQGVTKTAQVSVLVSSGNEPTVTTSADEFLPDDLDISVGETVIFVFAGATHNVTFEEEAPPAGSIGDTAPGNAVARTFTTPGDYDYECTIHQGMKGRIRVQ